MCSSCSVIFEILCFHIFLAFGSEFFKIAFKIRSLLRSLFPPNESCINENACVTNAEGKKLSRLDNWASEPG